MRIQQEIKDFMVCLYDANEKTMRDDKALILQIQEAVEEKYNVFYGVGVICKVIEQADEC